MVKCEAKGCNFEAIEECDIMPWLSVNLCGFHKARIRKEKPDVVRNGN